ncbi:MAG TPA: hypothetical protein VGQ91_05550 [Ideonella sp.]|jgi:hypothetical protein|nr:hypothetical protein [Ideonella sp.]
MSTIRRWPAALTLLALSGLFGMASAKPDYINGGIGTTEVSRIEAQAPAYNLRLVFSEGLKNDYISNVALRILDGQGREVLALDDAGPLTSVRLPAGHYVVDAKYGQLERRNPIELKPGAPVDLYLHFPNDEKLS